MKSLNSSNQTPRASYDLNTSGKWTRSSSRSEIWYFDAGTRGTSTPASTKWTVDQPRAAACLQLRYESSVQSNSSALVWRPDPHRNIRQLYRATYRQSSTIRCWGPRLPSLPLHTYPGLVCKPTVTSHSHST